jgi:hypothetical protein
MPSSGACQEPPGFRLGNTISRETVPPSARAAKARLPAAGGRADNREHVPTVSVHQIYLQLPFTRSCDAADRRTTKPDGTPPRQSPILHHSPPTPTIGRFVNRTPLSRPPISIERPVTSPFSFHRKVMIADVGGFLDMNKFVADGCVERLPPPAVHAQPKPPVANSQPIGRAELIVLVRAGVFFELIRRRIEARCSPDRR